MDSTLPILQVAMENVFFFGVMFIVTLAIVITIHEFGHYIAARICGVYVQTFAFGFGRELFGFGGGDKNRKTRWSFCMFPIGGFVKLFGDVDIKNPVVWDYENSCERTLSADELSVSFCTKPIYQRMFIIAAGPAINFALTLAIFIIVFSTYGQRSKPLVINAIAVNSAAYEAGIELGDNFIEMDGDRIQRLEDVYDLTWYEDPARAHEYKILRDGEVVSKTFTARRVEYKNIKGVVKKHGQTGMVRMRVVMFSGVSSVDGTQTDNNPDKARDLLLQNMDKEIYVGVPFKSEDEEHVDLFIMKFPSELNTHLYDTEHEYYDRAFLVDPEDRFYLRLGVMEASVRAVFWIKEMLVDSYKLINVAYKGKTDEPVLGGISKISEHTAKAAKAGLYDYLMFVAVFSLMIAIINLLPIPALDGGYLVFLLYELIVGKPIAPHIQNVTMIIGLVFLGGIMIFANVSDFVSLFANFNS